MAIGVAQRVLGLVCLAALLVVPGATSATEKPRKGRAVQAQAATTDRVAEQQAATFYALLKLADIKAAREGRWEASSRKAENAKDSDGRTEIESSRKEGSGANGYSLNLGYRIEVHLPATKDIEVYNAIFRSLRENILA